MANAEQESRMEQYLAYLAGDSNTYPQNPFTRVEQYLYKICENGISQASEEGIQTAVDHYLDEHPVEPTPIDDTLTQAGEAADAKAVGDRLEALENEVKDLRQLIIDVTGETDVATGIVDAGTELMTDEEITTAYDDADDDADDDGN